jgi:hypothetical protein
MLIDNVKWYNQTCHECQIQQMQRFHISPTVLLEGGLFHKAHIDMMVMMVSMVIALSMSRACQPHSGALLLCMIVSDSIHRTCKSDVSAL